MNALELYDDYISDWFVTRYSKPTPPQAQGWPAISRGEHVLIFAPTGSGKTLSAFLWGIQSIYRNLASPEPIPGVQLLYISPLKALNNDIERNLREPLHGIQAAAAARGLELPRLRTAVRTGDTTSSAKQQQVKRPPQILITTPESLYLILTSPNASEMLAHVRTVIVDEIHTLNGNKRGVHLGISLERLVERAGEFQRIGLSATQRPLDEVARYLGGQHWVGDQLIPRPVTIIDPGMKKELDLQVVTPVPDLRRLPGKTIWPSLTPMLLEEVRKHRSTLIYTNSRRGAERTVDRLNEQIAMEEEGLIDAGSPSALYREGVTIANGMFGTGRAGGPFQAHHGSVSKELRLRMEQQLKDGKLPALVGTSSLELGIDIGAVDAALQIQSPHAVSRGLQRIGRAGHQVGQTSYGRIYATFREDLLDAAAVARGMLTGDIEPSHTPHNCLDLVAQQVVAMVANQAMPLGQIHRILRRAYGYEGLTESTLRAVLDMLCGHYPSEMIKNLRAHLSWDRTTDMIHPLPGSRILAIRNGGTIADTGEYRVYLSDGKTSLGTLDEEFVNETRTGDVISLGSNTWRVIKLEEGKVLVAESGGMMPRMPFWNGEAPRRDYHLGVLLGRLRAGLAERVADIAPLPDDLEEIWPEDAEAVCTWLRQEYAMDAASARNAVHYVRHQLDAIGAISSHRTIVLEHFSDPIGDQRLVIHSCFGSRVNSAWAIALVQALEERWRVVPEVGVNNDGILLRYPDADRDPPFDLIRSLHAEEARERILINLPNTAIFGTAFRINAQRALLLPRVQGSKHTPFWLQRLRARDLLAALRGFPDFPLLVETYRDCLRDILDVEHLAEVLDGIQQGKIRMVEAHTVIPSPVASGILYDFNQDGVYVTDDPKAQQDERALAVNRELLGQLLEAGAIPDLIKPGVLEAAQAEMQHTADGYRVRSREELAVILEELGDLTGEELLARAGAEGPCWLDELIAVGRIVRVPGTELFAIPEHQAELALALDTAETEAGDAALERILQRYAARHVPFDLCDLHSRYGVAEERLQRILEDLTARGMLVYGRMQQQAEPQWSDRHVLEQLHRRSLSQMRQQVKPVPLAAWQDFRLRWQGLHPDARHAEPHGLTGILQQLRGLSAPVVLWERDILPLRVVRMSSRELDDLVADGELVWQLSGTDANRVSCRWLLQGDAELFGSPLLEPLALSAPAEQLLAILRAGGAQYALELQNAAHLSAHELDRALRELALAGLITNDRLRTLDLLRDESTATTGSQRMTSSLSQLLSDWRRSQPLTPGKRPSRAAFQQAQERAMQRIAPGARWPGRWATLSVPQPLTREQIEQTALLLLQRHGVLTRDCLSGEELGCTWSELYEVLQTLELRGQIRRGYFVRGLAGAQFALPDAYDTLRNTELALELETSLVLANACDPALVPGVAPEVGLPALPRLAGNYAVFFRGAIVLTYQHGASEWQFDAAQGEGIAARAVELLREHLTAEGGLCSQPRRLRIAQWNGAPPLDQPIQLVLETLGFRRDTPAMVWDGR